MLMLILMLHLHTASNHSKCHLSLLNSSVATLLSAMSIVLLQLPQKTHKPVSFSDFLSDTFLFLAATIPHEFLIIDDINLHLDNLGDSQVKQFLSALDDTYLTQHVSFPTQQDLHTGCCRYCFLHVSISYFRSLACLFIWSFPYFIYAISPLPPPLLPTFSFRCLKSISISTYKRDIVNSRLITHPPTNLHDLIDTYNITLSALLNKHAPLKTKTIRAKTFNPWFTSALSKLKSARRHLEKVWLQTRSLQDLQPLRTATNAYHSSIIHAKRLTPVSREELSKTQM